MAWFYLFGSIQHWSSNLAKWCNDVFKSLFFITPKRKADASVLALDIGEDERVVGYL
jgi:hypothetical protein